MRHPRLVYLDVIRARLLRQRDHRLVAIDVHRALAQLGRGEAQALLARCTAQHLCRVHEARHLDVAAVLLGHLMC